MGVTDILEFWKPWFVFSWIMFQIKIGKRWKKRQGFNLDAVKTTLRGLRYFKITSLFADSWKTSPSCSVALSPLIESILSGSVGWGATFKLVGCLIKFSGTWPGLVNQSIIWWGKGETKVLPQITEWADLPTTEHRFFFIKQCRKPQI